MKARSRSIHLSVHIHKDPAAMAERAAHILAAACEEAVAERGMFRIALSGGQTPIPLFRLLAASDWADRLPWDKMNFFWVDERCVGPDHPDSNYGLARRELLSHVPATHFYRMRGDIDPVEAAVKYEQQIRQDFNIGPNDLPRFDFMILGMGDDGHTGSIFPNSPALAERKRLVIDQYVPERKADRLTLTLPVINNSRCCMFLVTGKEKHQVLGQVLDLLAEPTLPAQMVRPSVTKEGPHRDPSFFCGFCLPDTFATTHHPRPGSLPARDDRRDRCLSAVAPLCRPHSRQVMRGRDCPAVPLGPAGKTFEPAPARRLQLVQHTGLGHDLGPVFEVHQIVFVPFAAPDEALGLEGPDDLAVVGLLQRMALHPGPAPVRRPLRAQVDGDTEGMRAQALLSGNGAPQKASGRDQPGLELRPLPHGLAQAAVHGGQRPHGGPAHPHLAPLQGRHAQAPADRGRIRTVQGLQKA